MPASVSAGNGRAESGLGAGAQGPRHQEARRPLGVQRTTSAPRSQVVLITGATRGFGRLATFELSRRGHRVVATGRDQELLASLATETKGLQVTVRQLDVTEEPGRVQVVAEVVREHGRIDALVNNAGYGLWGPLEDLSGAEVRALFETNVFACLRLYQLVMPTMRAQAFGTVVNVGSMAGQIGMPAGGAYASSKAALQMLSRIMRHEARLFGVRVVHLEPGSFQTEFHSSQVIGAQVERSESPYARHLNRLRTKPQVHWRPDPHPVAVKIRQVIESQRPAPRYAVGMDARAGATVARVLPDRVLDEGIRIALRW